MNTLVKTFPKYESALRLSDSPFGQLSNIMQNRLVIFMAGLIFAVFISAVGVVYNQEENRILFNELSSLQHARDNMFMTWGQLLLEESTWSTQARIQKFAATKLNMVMPNQKNIVIVRQ